MGHHTMSNMRLKMRALNYVLIAFLLLGLAACGSRSPSSGLAAPTQVEAVRTSGGMLVTWKDNSSDETGFRIYRYQGLEPLSVDEAEANFESGANTVEYTDNQVDLSADYTYRVQAFNDVGVSSAVGVGEEPEDAPPPEGQARIIVERVGGGKGQIISDPQGIACDHVSGDNCSATFDFGTTVTLEPQPSSDSVFEGWGGQCEGSEACTFSVLPELTDANGNIRVSANIRQLSATLSVNKTGSGSGRVFDLNSGGDIIDCGETCSVSYSTASPVIVVLEATPAAGFSFGGWRGAPCEGQSGDCRVTIDRDITLEALFAQPAPSITSFSASPNTIEKGREATLSWTLGGSASGVRLSAFANGVTSELNVPQGASSIKVRPDVSTTYTLVAIGEGGESAAQETTVTVKDAPSITSFEAEDDTVLTRTETTLNWSISGDGVTGIALLADGNRVNRNIPVTATSTLVRPRKTTLYTLVVETAFGRLEAQTTVRVGKAPEIKDFEPTKSPIAPGKRAELTWDVEGATELRIDNGIGIVTGRNVLSDILNETTEFELTATNDFGESRETTTVEVDVDELPKPKITAFTVKDNKLQVREGEQIILEWEIENQDVLTDLRLEYKGNSDAVGNPKTTRFLPTEVASTTKYTLRAIALSGEATESVTVEVIPPATIETFVVPEVVTVGEQINVSWTGVTGVRAELLVNGQILALGSEDLPGGERVFTAPPTLDEVTFELNAVDALGELVTTGPQTVQILPGNSVGLPVIDSFEANATTIKRGEQVTLSWDIPRQDTLTRLVMLRDVGDTLISQNPTEDSILLARPSETTTYTLEIENEDGVTRSQPITITVEDSDLNIVPDDAGFETF